MLTQVGAGIGKTTPGAGHDPRRAVSFCFAAYGLKGLPLQPCEFAVQHLLGADPGNTGLDQSLPHLFEI